MPHPRVTSLNHKLLTCLVRDLCYAPGGKMGKLEKNLSPSLLLKHHHHTRRQSLELPMYRDHFLLWSAGHEGRGVGWGRGKRGGGQGNWYCLGLDAMRMWICVRKTKMVFTWRLACCSVMQCVAVCCSVLQCAAVYVVECVAVCCICVHKTQAPLLLLLWGCYAS